MEKAVIYCRANSASELSIVNQEKSCRRFAENNNFVVDSVYADKGEVGDTAQLKELQRLLGYAIVAKNKPSAIIVARLDRLTRNLADYLELQICLQTLGIKVVSAEQDEQYEDSAVGNLQRNIKIIFAQFEQSLRAERTRALMKHRKDKLKK